VKTLTAVNTTGLRRTTLNSSGQIEKAMT